MKSTDAADSPIFLYPPPSWTIIIIISPGKPASEARATYLPPYLTSSSLPAKKRETIAEHGDSGKRHDALA